MPDADRGNLAPVSPYSGVIGGPVHPGRIGVDGGGRHVVRSPILLAAFEILLRFALRGARVLAEHGEAAPGRHEGAAHADVRVLLDLALTGPALDLLDGV